MEWRVPAWVVKGDSSNMSARAGVEEQLRRRSDEVEEQGSSSALGSGERVEDARRRA